ncbi:MAG: hypothetical protein COT17_02690 [Elusimicrobia bacterium CG08_land_8_20_14_0_20_51_18]|nr:MAG: hypothetical protein COT17_02690 [Elusimicrobia bacterium CG08_land_8_20_14_0_20_51_18]
MKKITSILLTAVYFFNLLPAFALELPSLVEKDYYISAGDVISMNVFPAEEFSKEVTVQPDGSIEIPLLGSVKVSGMKVSELEKLLTARFSKYVSNPTITVNVRKFSSYRVAVIGQVQRTGYHEYNEGMKILDLIALAGGLNDYANTSDVRVFRKTKDAGGTVKEDSFEINLAEVMGGRLDKNIPLVSGDIVYIPKRRFTTASKWVTDHLLPWTMLATFAITIGIITTK